MITSIDAEEGTWKNLISLYDNNSMKRVKKKCNNVIKAIYNKLIANNILSGEKLKTFPLRSYNHVSTWPMKKMRNVEFFVIVTELINDTIGTWIQFLILYAILFAPPFTTTIFSVTHIYINHKI